MVDLIFVGCEILIICSYLFRNMLLLRIMTIFGMLGYVVGGWLAGFDSPGMKAVILFSFVAVLINLYQCIFIFIRKYPIFIPEHLKKIYQHNFSMMTTNEFHRISKFASIKKFEKKSVIAVQGKPIDDLLLILNGEVNIIKNNEITTKLGVNFFIGEMSYMTGGPVTATVEAIENDVECLVWNKNKLNQLKNKNIDLYNKFKQAIIINLVQKLEQSSKK